MEMEEEVEKEEEEEIVITLQDIAEVAMTEEAGKKQADGCQREEDDNQLDSDLSKVILCLLFQNLTNGCIL